MRQGVRVYVFVRARVCVYVYVYVFVRALVCMRQGVRACAFVHACTAGYLSFGPIGKNIMLFVTSACARRPGL